MSHNQDDLPPYDLDKHASWAEVAATVNSKFKAAHDSLTGRMSLLLRYYATEPQRLAKVALLYEEAREKWNPLISYTGDLLTADKKPEPVPSLIDADVALSAYQELAKTLILAKQQDIAASIDPISGIMESAAKLFDSVFGAFKYFSQRKHDDRAKLADEVRKNEIPAWGTASATPPATPTQPTQPAEKKSEDKK